MELPDIQAKPVSTKPVESPESPDDSDLANFEYSSRLVSFTERNLDDFLQLDQQVPNKLTIIALRDLVLSIARFNSAQMDGPVCVTAVQEM